MPKLYYRKLSLAPGAEATGPASIDEASRSVEVIGATEAAIPERDYDSWEVYPTIITMAGCQLPESRQLPLLDSHSRYDTSSVIGSFRDMRIEGDKLVGRATFSAAPEAESAWLKTREGHLTDYSVGRVDEESTIVAEGQTAYVGGRSYTGPVKIVTKWKPREMSVCPIGADENAKARADSSAPPIKEHAMNRELRAFLERRGLPQDATDAEAQAFMDKLEVKREESAATVTSPPVDVEAVRVEAVKNEQARSAEIIAMCERFEIPTENRAALLKPEVTVDSASKAIMDEVIARAGKNTPNFRPSVEIVADEKDKFRSAAEDALSIRAGITVNTPSPGATDLTGHSLREIARLALRAANQPTGGNVMEMVGRALTTSDFPNLLANVANKSLSAGYETAPETWEKWCGTGSVSDFKTNSLMSVSEAEDLTQITDSQPYEYGKRSDAKEQYAIATYGKMFAITRQTIINDDLSALSDIPRAHGEAAARKIGDVAYAVLTANSAMRDGIALFHASHGNLGTAGVFGTTTLAEAVKLMALQKDIGGKRRLNLSPKYVIAPPSIALAVETFLKSTVIGTQAQPNQTNIYANLVEMVFEPRLYDDSQTAWYLAGPKGKTVTVFFLNGQQTPYMETRQGWNVDGVEYKVRIDCGAKAVDWPALLKNAGA